MNDDELLNEEKSYYEWVAKNLSYIHDNKSSVSVMKKLYTEGFMAGFAYRDKINATEQLQK